MRCLEGLKKVMFELAIVTTEDSEENKEKAKQEDTNNYYLIDKVY